MKVFDTIVKKEKVTKLKPICIKQKSLDFIISILHGGSFIPIEFKNHVLISKNDFACDPFTKKLYKFNKGISIISNISPAILNLNRTNNYSKNRSLPLHLRRDIIHNPQRKLLKKYSKKEKNKLLSYYTKYHSLLKDSIKKVKRKNGFVLLFDCHSLSSIGPKGSPDHNKKRADFVIGTLDDKSANKKIVNYFIKELIRESKNKYKIKKNYPYKGGYILRKYSNPKKDIHGIQIEVNRDLYFDGKRRKSLKNMENINNILFKVINSTFRKVKELYF